jgi:hypothetical protein
VDHLVIRPGADEHAPFYSGYIARVPTGNILDAMQAQHSTLLDLLSGVSDEHAERAYAPGKWTLKEMVQHVVDSERVFSFRALWFARGDRAALPGFEQDDWIEPSAASDRRLPSIADEFRAVRESTVALFSGLPSSAWTRRGIASEREVSVRALAFIIVGHALHHEAILRERYLAR